MRPATSLLTRRSAPRLLLELDLTRGLQEAPPASPVEAVRGMHVPSLRGVVEGLRQAAGDPRVAGLVTHIGGRQPTLAQSGELRAAVEGFRRAGKTAVCWSETFGELAPGNVGYHLASAFDEIWLQPSGDVGLVGFTAEAVFLRDALDKLGIQVQLGQRHEYKTAADTFLQSSLTEANREMLGRLVESSTETLVRDVAAGRRLSEAEVRSVIDTAPVSPADALDRGLVDRLGYRDEVYAGLRDRLGEVELKYVERYGKGARAQARAAVSRRGKPVVALVHAAGPIHLGRGSATPISGRSVGSDSLAAALRAAASDDDVKAVVLRIDSPGGSYVASDTIRREVLALRGSGRPVIASMANVAASGGYFIAMAADRVVAGAGTITGSIGVLAGKQVIRETLARVGVRRDHVAAGRYADMFSTDRPFDEEEWSRLEGWLDRVYDDFTGKAAEDRGMPVEELRAVARGRVWTGADALRHGLVDELGGLERAVGLAASQANLAREDVELRVLPKTTLVERLLPADNSESPAAAAALGAGASLSGAGATLFERLLATSGVAPYGVLSLPMTWRLQ
jgi:protease IV